MEMTWVAPDACTLPTAEQPLRVAEFDQLFHDHLTRVDTQRPEHLSLHFTGPPGVVEMVADLAARESSCCSFFTFATTLVAESGDKQQVRLDVDVPANRVDVLTALAARAEAAGRP